MPDYQKGKIYTIRNKNDSNLIYVGSTCKKYLSDRMGNHRSNSKKNPNSHFYKLINDWNDWYIELYENFPCNNKNELTKREGEVIREIGTLNIKNAGLNLSPIINGDKKQYGKEYNKIRDKTKKKEQEKSKVKCPLCDLEVTRYKLKRHQESRNCKNIVQVEKDAEKKEIQRIKNNEYYNRRYYEKKDEILAKQKANYETKKDIINEKRRNTDKPKINCDHCGMLVSKMNILTHKKTQKCINFKPS